MAYKPTLSDIEEIQQKPSEGGFTPSLADIPQQAQPTKFMGISFQPQHSPLQALLNIGGGIAQGAESAVAGLENLPRDVGLLGRYFGVPGVRQLAKLPSVHPMAIPGVQQQDIMTQIPQAATEALGYLGTGGAAGLRGAERVAGAAGRGISRLASPISGKNAADTAVNFFKKISRGRGLRDLHTPLNNKIKELYKNTKLASKKNYDYVHELAKKAGFGDELVAPTDRIEKEGLQIISSKSTPLMGELNVYRPEAKEALLDFKKTPSFKNAHKLQSELFKEQSALRNSLDPADRAKSFATGQARNALREDILDSFDQAGNGWSNTNQVLKKAYLDASEFHKNEVAPFLENRLVSNMLLKRKGMKHNPEGIFNLLQQPEESARFIKERLSPEDRDLFVAHGLSPAVRRIGGKLKINPAKFINEFNKLENKGLREFVDPTHEFMNDKIENQFRSSKLIRKYGLRGLELAGAGAAVGGGIKAGRELF